MMSILNSVILNNFSHLSYSLYNDSILITSSSISSSVIMSDIYPPYLPNQIEVSLYIHPHTDTLSLSLALSSHSPPAIIIHISPSRITFTIFIYLLSYDYYSHMVTHIAHSLEAQVYAINSNDSEIIVLNLVYSDLLIYS
jgi:hypothetical protein